MKRVILALVAIASTAHAGDKDKADTLFKRGKKLMDEKKYSEACEAFEQSMKLDPQIGTELNVGRCFEEWGKLGRALRSYKSAEKLAKDANDSRTAKIDELIEQLDSQVPRLTIHVPEGADTSSITVDGAPVSSLEGIVLDPGPHKVEYVNAAGTKKSRVVPVERGGSSEINLDLLAKAKGDHTTTTTTAVQPPPPKHVDETPDPGRGYQLAAYGLGGAGVVAIGVSTYLTISAKSKYNDALKTHCGGMTDGCDDIGLKDTHDARHQANIGTVVFIGGAAAVAGGVVLYLLQPHAKPGEKPDEAMYVVPAVAPDSAGLVFGGRF